MYYYEYMENKNIIFRDHQGYVELAGLVGNDLAVFNSPAVFLGYQSNNTELGAEAAPKIRHLIEQDQNGSLEHCTLMFKIRAPLFVAREHMAMPGWSCNETDKYQATAATKFYEPGSYREANQHGFDTRIINPVLQDRVKLGRFRVFRATKALSLFHESALRLYKHMVEAGICREQAMAVLPQNVYIEYCASANLKDVLRFANCVDDEKALPELREVAQAVLKIARNDFPITTEEWRQSTKKRQTNVAQRLEKLSNLVSLSERLVESQMEKIKKAQTHLDDNKEETEIETRNLQEGRQGTGSSASTEKGGRQARWGFWKKNRRGGKKVSS